MHTQDTPSRPTESTPQADRREIARILDFVDRCQADGLPVTELSAAEGVPRSNLYYWQSRKEQIDAPEAVRDFFESAVGLEALHWIYWAAMFTFVQVGAAGWTPWQSFCN